MIEDGSPITESDLPNSAQDLRVAMQAHDLGLLRSLGICLPACVYSYDRDTHTAEVMPLVKQAFYNGKWEYIRKKPFKVSVRNIQCGGFTVDIPVYVGDTGWVFSSDRDTLLVKQKGALTNSVLEGDRPIAIVEDDYQQVPNTPALHAYVHGFFIPDNWGNWETHRYKDKQGLDIGHSLYIGSSMDTDDGRQDYVINKVDPETNQIIKEGKTYQKGTAYEQKSSSSIVMQRNGGIALATSSPQAAKQSTNVSIGASKASIEALDKGQKLSSSVNVDATEGIIINQDVEGENQHFICAIQPGTFLLRMIDKENTLTFSFNNGKLNVSTTSDVNMRVGGDTSFRCKGTVNVTGEKDMNVHAEGNVNVRASKDANVSSINARLVAENYASVTAKKVSVAAAEDANVNAGGNVNIGAAVMTNINSASKVNLAAGKDINITAPDRINIVTANDATIMAKKKGAKILVTTLSKDSSIDVVAKGKNSKMDVTFNKKESSVNLTMKDENSSVNIVTEKDKSPIAITTKGVKSDIKIAASNASVTMEADKEIKISSKGNVVVEAQNNITVNSQQNVSVEAKDGTINLSGNVNVKGTVKINDLSVKPAVHGPDDSIKYWAHD